MSYIVLDLEWNQAMSSNASVFNRLPIHLSGEIIQIGAVKLDDDFCPAEEFQSDVRPIYFRSMHYKVKKLTGIDKERLSHGDTFPTVFEHFREWCGEDPVFVTWGYDDRRIMEQNIIFDGYYRSPLGEQFIEVSTSFRMMSMDMLRLYHMLSKVYYYRNATQQQAKLVLLTVQLPESYSPGYASDSPGEATARRLAALQKTFAPAIRNQLLEIIPMEITDDDISRIRKEVEESSAFKTDDPA